jgi:hypothetical protein
MLTFSGWESVFFRVGLFPPPGGGLKKSLAPFVGDYHSLRAIFAPGFETSFMLVENQFITKSVVGQESPPPQLETYWCYIDFSPHFTYHMPAR